jgi:beta-phosphoglucomutase
MPYPKAVIFDMDGTLIDNMDYHKQSWIALFQELNLTLAYDTFDQKYHKGSLVEIMGRLLPDVSDPLELQRIGSKKEELYRDMYRPHITAISGALSFIHYLFAKNTPIGLATMGDQHNIDLIFERLAMASFFHSTTGGHEITHGKPHPEIFLTAAKKLGVAPKDCVVFEDTRSGVTAARAAGMEVIGVTTMFDEKTLLKLGCRQAIADYNQLDWKQF